MSHAASGDGSGAPLAAAAAWFGPGLGAGPGSAWFRPVRDEAGALVVLHEGRLARVLLAELASGGGTAVRFAWKLQRDVPEFGPGRDRSGPSNGEIDAHWRRERDRHAAVAAHGSATGVLATGVLATVPVPESVLDVGPLAYCRRRQIHFPIGCVRTGERLAVCRDEARLAAHGLAPYATGGVRYLSPVGGAAAVYYRLALDRGALERGLATGGERPRPGVEVLDAAGWLRELPALAEPSVRAEHQRAAAWLPCCTCPERAACHARGGDGRAGVEQAVEVVSFHGGHALALELADGDFDALMDRLGRAKGAVPGPGWSTAGDRRRWPGEVLWAKVRVLQQLAAAVRAVHTATGSAHFGLQPGNVLAQWDASGAPWPWAARVLLADFGSGSERVPEHGPRHTVPGPEWRDDLRCRPYASPWLDDAEGRSRILPCVGRLVVPAPETALSGRAAAGLAAPGLASPGPQTQFVVDLEVPAGPRRFRPGDWVSIAAAGAVGELWCRITEVRPRGCTALAVEAPPELCAALAAASSAACTFHRATELPVDSFALGMLLLRTLVVHDATSIEDVRECVDRQLLRWRAALAESPAREASSRMQFRAALQQQFPAGAWLFDVADRQDPTVRTAVQEPLLVRAYTGLLDLAVVLLLAGEPEAPPTDLAALDALLERQLGRCAVSLEVEVCQAQRRDLCLAELLRTLAVPAGAGPAAAMQPAAALAQPLSRPVLEIVRDGQAEVRRFELGRAPVTIGRHDTENTLCLGDPIVSARHALVEWQGEGYTVLDRGSRNGTEVDGVRLPIDVPFPLADGSVVRIAPFRLQLRLQPVPRATSAGGLGELPPEELLAVLQEALAACLDAAPASQQSVLAAALQAATPSDAATGWLAQRSAVLQKLDARLPAAAGGQGRGGSSAAEAWLLELAEAIAGERVAAERLPRLFGRLVAFAMGGADLLGRLQRQRTDLRDRFALPGSSAAPSSWQPPSGDGRELLRGWLASEAPAAALEAHLAAVSDELVAVVEALRDGAVAIRSLAAAAMAPDKLLEEAGGGAINALACKAPVWRKHQEAWTEVAQGSQFLLTIERELQRLVAERQSRGQSPPVPGGGPSAGGAPSRGLA